MKTFHLISVGDFHTDAGLVEHGTVVGQVQLDDSVPIANLTSLLRTGRLVSRDHDSLDPDGASDEDQVPSADPPQSPAPEVETPEPEVAEAPEVEVVDSPVVEAQADEPQTVEAPAAGQIPDEKTLVEAGVEKKYADLYESDLGITTVGQLRANVADGGKLADPNGVGPVTAKLVGKLIGI